MYIVDRTLQFTRGFLLSYGPTPIKKFFWNREFSNGQWNFLDDTTGDCVYSHLESFSVNRSILDLGCGPGNTANELAPVYLRYVGMDISEEALAKARRRTEQNGRSDKNSFERGDFLSYMPSQKFDVILFREAMYHVPLGKVEKVLDRFSEYLTEGGVFIVRLYVLKDGKTKYRPSAMIGIMERDFDVVEKSHYPESGSTVIVFRPKGMSLGANGEKNAAREFYPLAPRAGRQPLIKRR
jgi:SAM-dependent methyltransferase